MKLEIGYKNGFDIRHESIHGAVAGDIRLMHITDLHLTGCSGFIVNQLISAVKTLNPQVILLGGDYADTRKGLKQLSAFLKTITPGRRVFAIPGNHDQFLWAKEIKRIILSHDVTWLDNSSTKFILDKTTIHIDGGKPSANNISADIAILLLHKPVDICSHQNKYDLALAGHLHGCQFVFWETEKGLYPGRLLYKWNILKKQIGRCLYLVSKGVDDTLPIRYNCRKDIILVTIRQ